VTPPSVNTFARYDEKHERHADKRCFEHTPWSEITKIDAEKQRDGNGHSQGEGGPRRTFQRIHYHQRDHGQQNNHNRKHGKLSDEAAALADFVAGHFAQRFSVAPDGAEQDHEILHAAGKCRAGDQPQRSRQIAKLRRERRPDQRPRPGNRGEVVAEEHPFVSGHKIAAVVAALGGCGARVIERQQLCRDECRIKSIRHQVRARRGQNKPRRVDRLATMKSDGAERDSAKRGHGGPD
jgi:hypothetical protein